MSESFDDYKQRLLGYLGDRDPIDVLGATAKDLRAPVVGKDEAVLRASPSPGKWSVAQIAAHLADDEIVLGWRLRAVLADSGCEIAGFDQATWANTMRYAEIPAATSLERFDQMRAWNLDLLRGLRPEEWERYGIHSERGRESVRDMARLYAGHDLNHTLQIARIVGT
ncbi:MAG: DinB family protein [Thermoanaerobaculia bacterium]